MYCFSYLQSLWMILPFKITLINACIIFRLQNEFVQLQNELARVQEGKAESSENLQKLVHSLQAQLATKSREVTTSWLT